jgi:hypothetical protein
VGLTLGVVNALASFYYAVGLYGGNNEVILWVKQNCVSSVTIETNSDLTTSDDEGGD